MHIVFITRCYKPTNIQKIKDNLKEVFSKQTEHTYQQYLVVDMTRGGKEEEFNIFKDNVTHVQFTYQKTDYYNYDGVDKVINTINKENTFVYVLDDDNLIKDNFLHVFDKYDNEDLIIFRNDGPSGYHDGVVSVGYIDLCNYITKLQVAKQIKFYDGEHTYTCDGRFACSIIRAHKKINFIKRSFVIYAALSKPSSN